MPEKLSLSSESESAQRPRMQNQQSANTSADPPGADGGELQLLDFVSPDFDALEALRTKELQPPDRTVQPLNNLDECREILLQEPSTSIINTSISKPEEGEPLASPVLDFLSSNFDALEALQIKGLQPPYSSVQPLDNLEECHEILPQELSLSAASLPAKTLSASQVSGVIELQEEASKVQPSFASLDFLSPEFDALEALRTKDLQPPNPRVRPLDNLNRCRRILPEEVPQSIVNITLKTPRSSESIHLQERAKARKSLILQKAAERARQVKIFDTISEKLKHGPLSLLMECYQQRVRVKVWTRHTHGVRGSLTGFLGAFDKHLNMVLQDIDEEYSVRRWVPRLVRRRGRSLGLRAFTNEDPEHSVHLSEGSASAPDITQEVEEITAELKKLRLFPKLEHRRRHLNQVFLRGDSVVMVQKLM